MARQKLWDNGSVSGTLSQSDYGNGGNNVPSTRADVYPWYKYSYRNLYGTGNPYKTNDDSGNDDGGYTPQPSTGRTTASTGNDYGFNWSGYDAHYRSLLEQIQKLRDEQIAQAKNQYDALLSQSKEQLLQDNAQAAREMKHNQKLYNERRPQNSGPSLSNYARINSDYTNSLKSSRMNYNTRNAGYASNYQTGLQNIRNDYANNYNNQILTPMNNLATQALNYGDIDAYRQIINSLTSTKI